jgi:hypothetical protein
VDGSNTISVTLATSHEIAPLSTITLYGLLDTQTPGVWILNLHPEP